MVHLSCRVRHLFSSVSMESFGFHLSSVSPSTTFVLPFLFFPSFLTSIPLVFLFTVYGLVYVHSYITVQYFIYLYFKLFSTYPFFFHSFLYPFSLSFLHSISYTVLYEPVFLLPLTLFLSILFYFFKLSFLFRLQFLAFSFLCRTSCIFSLLYKALLHLALLFILVFLYLHELLLCFLYVCTFTLTYFSSLFPLPIHKRFTLVPSFLFLIHSFIL